MRRTPPQFAHHSLVVTASVLLAACGGSDSSTQPPPPKPVSGSLAMTWTEHPTLGGDVEAIVRRGHEVFLISREDEVVRFDTINNAWSTTEARGDSFAQTTDGYLFTDWGYRLVPGEDTWEQVDAWRISVGSNGRSLYAFDKEWESVITSSDYGETWSELPSVPGGLRANALEVDGDVYLATRGDNEGLWRLPEGSSDWEELPLTAFVTRLAPLPGGGIVAVTLHFWPDALYWSADGSEWSHPTYSGDWLINPGIVGRDADNNVLIGDRSTLYTLNGDGILTERLQLPGEQPSPLTAVSIDPSGPDYAGGEDGVWRTELDDLDAGSEHIGLPGDHAGNLFHLSTGTYSGINGSLQRFDPTSNRWERIALGCCGIYDVEELAGGDLLLAVTREGGYGDLLVLKPNRDIKRIILAGPVMRSVTVTDSGEWLVATGRWREGPNYDVIASSDEGDTWTTVEPGGVPVTGLATVCGKTLGAAETGLWRYSNGNWAYSADISDPVSGIVARGDRAVAYSDTRIWYQADCDAPLRAIGFPSEQTIKSVAIDDTGRVWVGTEQRGIVYDPASDEWSWFDEALPDGEIRVSMDKTNNVWVRVVGDGVYSGRLN